mgnify:CR=1 FL=1
MVNVAVLPMVTATLNMGYHAAVNLFLALAGEECTAQWNATGDCVSPSVSDRPHFIVIEVLILLSTLLLYAVCCLMLSIMSGSKKGFACGTVCPGFLKVNCGGVLDCDKGKTSGERLSRGQCRYCEAENAVVCETRRQERITMINEALKEAGLWTITESSTPRFKVDVAFANASKTKLKIAVVLLMLSLAMSIPAQISRLSHAVLNTQLLSSGVGSWLSSLAVLHQCYRVNKLIGMLLSNAETEDNTGQFFRPAAPAEAELTNTDTAEVDQVELMQNKLVN